MDNYAPQPSARGKFLRAAACILLLGLLQMACASSTWRSGPEQAAATLGAGPDRAATPASSETPAPTQTAAPTARPNTPRLAGYFLASSSETEEAATAASMLTDIIYAFIGISPEGRCFSTDPDLDEANFAAFRQMKEQNPGLRVLFSIGGKTSARFPKAAASASARRAFARSCVELLQRGGFDGVDIDWEFPNRGGQRPEERKNFTALITEFRKQLDAREKQDGRAYLLTFAAPAGKNEAMGMDFRKLAPLVDWVNVMTYSYYDENSEVTNLEAALYPVESDPGSKAYNVDSVVQQYRAAGVPAKKILVGVVFYGRGWKGVPAANDGLFQPPRGAFSDPGAPEGAWSKEGVIGYDLLRANYLDAPGWERHWQEEAQAPWLYNAEKKAFITYEDGESLEAKAAYALKHHLGGVMVWQVGADGPDNELLTALSGRLLR